MRIMHLASFNGNIGDVLSHAGLYEILDSEFGIKDFDITRLDIRRFYKNAKEDQLYFNNNCAVEFNKFDLVIIGGGGFLNQAFPDSISGNTFDFELDFVANIQTKILFYSIGGLNAKKESTKIAYDKTEYFLETLSENPNFEFLYRTDGSVKNSKFLSKIALSNNGNVKQIFDSAYLNNICVADNPENYVILNIGFDQAIASKWGINDVAKRMAEIVKAIYDVDGSVQFKFVPHTYYDIEAFSELCRFLPEHIKRNNLKCLETFSLFTDLEKTTQVYRNARFAITGRFHSSAFAFLYTGNFLPIYNFDRSTEQLYAVGLSSQRIVTEMLALKAYIKPEDMTKLVINCKNRLQKNRNLTVSYLKTFLDT